MEFFALPDIGDVTADIGLSDLLPTDQLRHGDVLVVSSKVVAKAEGRVVACPSTDAAARRKLIESESVRILRRRGELLITETKHGFICANAGIDWSNTHPGTAVLLPVDPDNSAHRLRNGILHRAQIDVAVIISDTNGRAWRNGVTDIAIGCAGIRPLLDLRGTTDAYGNKLMSTQICIVDQLAGAAELVMGKASGTPVVVARGVDPAWFGEGSVKADVLRRPTEDLFR